MTAALRAVFPPGLWGPSAEGGDLQLAHSASVLTGLGGSDTMRATYTRFPPSLRTSSYRFQFLTRVYIQGSRLCRGLGVKCSQRSKSGAVNYMLLPTPV